MRYRTLLFGLAALVAMLFVASLLLGASSLGPRASLVALWSGEGAARLAETGRRIDADKAAARP